MRKWCVIICRVWAAGVLSNSLYENDSLEFRLQALRHGNRLKAELRTQPGPNDFSNRL
jgi:hypothetical protein